MDDRQIVELYWARNEAAISETDKKYGPYCRYIAARILSDERDAEEVVSDTYLRTWETLPPERPHSLKSYVGKLSNRLAIDRYRANHAEKRGGGELPLVYDELSEAISGEESSIADGVALSDALNRFLSSLATRDRRLFVLRYWYAASVSEIAREFDLTESHVTVLLHRTRGKLKKTLQKEGFEV